MVKLLVFRTVSLVGLLGLLLWELLYEASQDETSTHGTGFLRSRFPDGNIPGNDFHQGFLRSRFPDGNIPGNDFIKVENSIQEQRKQALIDYCHDRDARSILPRGTNKFEIPSYLFRNVIVSDKHNLMYCYIPKVACSNWKRVLMVLNEDIADPYQVNTADVHNRSLGYFRYLNEYSPEEIVHRLNTYYKFLFVRHPFERLVSAYRNKFIDSYNLTLFKKLYGRTIIRHFRHNPDEKSLKTGEGVSFSEFVNYLLTSDTEFMDRHWKQYDLLCHPCLIYYDYIGHFENLKPEADELLRTLQVNDRVKFPHNITSNYKRSSSALAKEYFQELSKESKEGLKKIYRHDFKMFGYSTEEYLS